MSQKCRLCGASDLESVLDLGASPPCELFLTKEQLDATEPNYPLHLRICGKCSLVQLPALIAPDDIFSEYAYYSSFSPSYVEHARSYVDRAVNELRLAKDSFVVEVASNDGYLLQHVVERGIRCLGIEPSRNVGDVARQLGIPTETAFLSPESGSRIRSSHGPANLVVANNVYAHVPDLIGFTKGLAQLVADDGWITIEVQHLLSLVELTQFDTIYHEHFQYYTVTSAMEALASGGLSLVDVELIPTHGGSIRLWAQLDRSASAPSDRVRELMDREQQAGLLKAGGFDDFVQRVARVKRDLLRFLIDAADGGKRVVGYGAPGKGNTLLNYCGIRPDLLAYTVDRNPYKHGRFTPGTRIPVVPVEQIAEDRPDFVLVLPWNLRAEITQQLAYIGDWGGNLVYAIPALEVLEPRSGNVVDARRGGGSR